MKQVLMIAVLAIAFASCSTKYEKTASGLTYKIIEGSGKREPLKAGQIIKINGQVKIQGRDSILFTTYGRMPEYLPVDTSTRKSHDFNEVIRFASVGDSVIVISQVDTLVKMGLAQYNEVLKKGDQILTTIKILKVFNNEQERMADQQKEADTFKQREVAELEAILKKKGIKTQKTANGVFVEIINAGDTARAVPGKKIMVNYTGSLVSTGKKFDSNVDTTFGHATPFGFVLGTGAVIPGWDEGLQMFGKGGKGNLYVPSLLAYGPQGSPPVIPPFSALKFEVEITDITTAPPAQQQMPQMSEEDLKKLQQQMQQQQGTPPAKN